MVGRAIKALKGISDLPKSHFKNLKRGPTFSNAYPWIYFDGTYLNGLCDGGFVLYLSTSHYFAITLGTGGGTNTDEELLTF